MPSIEQLNAIVAAAALVAADRGDVVPVQEHSGHVVEISLH